MSNIYKEVFLVVLGSIISKPFLPSRAEYIRDAFEIANMVTENPEIMDKIREAELARIPVDSRVRGC